MRMTATEISRVQEALDILIDIKQDVTGRWGCKDAERKLDEVTGTLDNMVIEWHADQIRRNKREEA